MHSKQIGGKDALYDLPASSVVVIRGKSGENRVRLHPDGVASGACTGGYVCMATAQAVNEHRSVTTMRRRRMGRHCTLW